MKFLMNAIFMFVLIFVTIQPIYAQESISEAIVKIYVVYTKYDYDNPWQILKQGRKSGSGCVISGKRILTNAHVVADHTFIQVKRAGEAKKYTADMEFVAHDCDLAVLKVNDDSFFSNMKPIEIGNLAKMRDKVAVYGFPVGGEELCITEGVVSRVEYQEYAHSRAYLLAFQIDAAINPGSSGGPVIKDGKIVGVAFQGLKGGENIGYMVPAPIIRHFLKDIEDGKYDGIPSIEGHAQSMENYSLRAKYQMSSGQTGVLVTYIPPGSSAENLLRPGDVILSIDGKTIENDGTIRFRDNERINADYVIHNKFIGNTVQCRILRDGNTIDVNITLTDPERSCDLVPFTQYDRAPTYFIVGGLVFQPLTRNYLDTWNSLKDTPDHLVNYFLNGKLSKDRKQVIVLTKVLGDEVNVGYEDFNNNVISKVNGKNVSSIEDLVRAIECNEGKYHIIVDEDGNQIVLEKSKVNERNQEILRKYKIPTDRSEDLKGI